MKNLARATTSILFLSTLLEETSCFTIPHATKRTVPVLSTSEFTRQQNNYQHQRRCIITLNAEKKKKKSNQNNSSAKGFGNKVKAEITVTKTYGDEINDDFSDLNDSNNAVEDFFRCRQEWNTLFRSIVGFTTDVQGSSSSSEDYYSPPLPAAMNQIKFDEGEVEKIDASFWDDDQKPWKQLPAIPTGEKNMATVGIFLDSAQQALLEIPVEERAPDDANDMHFVEEGRRCLVLSRFQVLGGGSEADEDGGAERVRFNMENDDELFATCWSEITYLVQDNQKDTGSLIMLPDMANSDMEALREFTERNILRPLDWLGLGDTFEVSSMQRGIPAIRLLHKLSDIPEPQPDDPEEE